MCSSLVVPPTVPLILALLYVGDLHANTSDGKLFDAFSESKNLTSAREEIDGDYGIETVRAKLMSDLQAAADKMKVAIFKNGEGDSTRRWRRRKGRVACRFGF